MRVLFATAELAPVAVVGGLASASSGLARELRRQGAQVEVVLPDYGGIALAGERAEPLAVPGWAGPAQVRRGEHSEAGPLTLVDVPGMQRPHPYLQETGEGWADNDRRFLAFGRAVAALATLTRPDVLHLNDWHTAAALAVLEPAPPSVLSIHNLAYQGVCDPAWLELLGPRSAAFEAYGLCNPLAGGIALADRVVAVSPTYAAEITRPEHGCGLDGLLRSREGDLRGILNGIETEVWDPAADPRLERPYGSATLPDKHPTTAALRRELGLADRPEVPLLVLVTRLTWQKGIDLLLPLLPLLPGLPAQLAVLGAGEGGLAGALREAATARPEELAFVEGYDDRLSHRLFGGGDLLLMPSRYEACGLSQMQALRYGTIPVVTDVGGLHDTVVDADGSPRAGTGFVAHEPSAVAMLDALHRACRAWRVRRRREAIQRRGMAHDWSWQQPAARYLRLYAELTEGSLPC